MGALCFSATGLADVSARQRDLLGRRDEPAEDAVSGALRFL
jgi:hypothetical protein